MESNFAPGFVVGFATGVIVVGFVGFVSSRILWHWGKVRAIGKPQTTKSTTDKTPWQVLIDGCKSLLTLLGISILVVIVLLLAAFFFDWEKVIAFVRSFAQP